MGAKLGFRIKFPTFFYHGMRCMPDHQQRFLVNDFSETSNFYQYGWHRGSHLPSLPNTVHSNGRSLAMYLTNKPTSRFRWHVIEEPLNDGGNMDRNVEFAYRMVLRKSSLKLPKIAKSDQRWPKMSQKCLENVSRMTPKLPNVTIFLLNLVPAA